MEVTGICASVTRPGRPWKNFEGVEEDAFDPSKFPGPFSKTKIVSTVSSTASYSLVVRGFTIMLKRQVGPSSESFEMIEKLWLGGVDVFRINLSHGNHDRHRKVSTTAHVCSCDLELT